MADSRFTQTAKFGDMSIADIINVTRNPPLVLPKPNPPRTKKFGISLDDDKPINPLSLTSRHPLSSKIEYLIDNKQPRKKEIPQRSKNRSTYDKYIGPGYYNLPSALSNSFTFSRTARFSEKFEDLINSFQTVTIDFDEEKKNKPNEIITLNKKMISHTPEARKQLLFMKSIKDKERSEKYREWKKELDRVLTECKRRGLESKFNRLKLKRAGVLGNVQMKWISLLAATTGICRLNAIFLYRKNMMANVEKYSRMFCLCMRAIGKFRMAKVRFKQRKAILALSKGRFRILVSNYVKNFRLRKANIIYDYLSRTLMGDSFTEVKKVLSKRITSLRGALKLFKAKQSSKIDYWLKQWNSLEKNIELENATANLSFREVSTDEKIKYMISKLALLGTFDISIVKEGITKLNYNL